MKELYYFLSICFILILAYIAYQDWKSKLIYLWSFYLLNIVGLFFLFYIDGWYAKYLMLAYFLWIIFLDILDYFDKLPKFISDDWMIGQTWIYDYWIYLFILVLFIDFLPNSFLFFYIWFSLSIILWCLIAWLITKKRYAKHIPLFFYSFFIILFMLITIFIFQQY